MWYVRCGNAFWLLWRITCHQHVHRWYVYVASFVWQDVDFVADDVVWVWYYDRQGCIQSEGINFLKDLPSFFVLLYALQRLKLEQWGLNAALDDRVCRAHLGNFDRSITGQILEPTEWPVTVDSKPFRLLPNHILHSALGIVGRGTVTVKAKSNDDVPRDLAIKIYWPENLRVNEATVISNAIKNGGDDPDIKNHLPTVLATQDLEYRTGAVRDALHIEGGSSSPHSRVLRLVVVTFLQPITDAPGVLFIRAWLQCVRCECTTHGSTAFVITHLPILPGHYKLWRLGFEHGDPSLGNLMIEPATKCGVLNDWDLSRTRHETGVEHLGGERTGTIPFMAMDLLTPEYFEGLKPPLYRHDLEGFIWILPWVFLQFDGPKFKAEQLHWGTGNYHLCHEEKAKMLDYSNIASYTPSKSWEVEWQLAKCLLMWLSSEVGERTARNFPLAEQVALLQRRRGGEGRAPGGGSLNGVFTEEQIQQIQQTEKLDYESSCGTDIDAETGGVDELAPAEVYDHFCKYLNGKGVRFYPLLRPLLSWDPM